MAQQSTVGWLTLEFCSHRRRLAQNCACDARTVVRTRREPRRAIPVCQTSQAVNPPLPRSRRPRRMTRRIPVKRLFPFIAVSLGLVAQPHAQQMSALLLPTLPGFSLGAGLSSAIANPANSSGGVTLLNGSATAGDCLIWGANGIQDAGSPCVASPIGTNRVTGTGAQSAPTLADRATDFGVTFNLKTDFGAYCDGNPAHDDTAAIQAWLGKAAPGVKLVAPAGACLFSAPLTVGAASHYTIEGAGPLSTEFKYAGTSTTATLLTINAPNTAAVYGVTLRDFRRLSPRSVCLAGQCPMLGPTAS